MNPVTDPSPAPIRREDCPAVRVSICDSYPLIRVGLQAIALDTGFALGPSGTSLADAEQMLRSDVADLLIVDRGFGVDGIVGLLEQHRLRSSQTSAAPYIVVIGFSFSKTESLRFMSAGARAVLRKGVANSMIVDCLRTVASGRSWIEPAVSVESVVMSIESAGLSRRERQVLPLVERGLTNKAIAAELGISAGTVKLHLKHIFEKTGLRGRRSILVYRFEGQNASCGDDAHAKPCDAEAVSLTMTAELSQASSLV